MRIRGSTIVFIIVSIVLLAVAVHMGMDTHDASEYEDLGVYTLVYGSVKRETDSDDDTYYEVEYYVEIEGERYTEDNGHFNTQVDAEEYAEQVPSYERRAFGYREAGTLIQLGFVHINGTAEDYVENRMLKVYLVGGFACIFLAICIGNVVKQEIKWRIKNKVLYGDE
ncbi:MAG: hypothetical protein R3Y67_05125 [Eubacteriales bacterium]